jgi:hypothetical protein
MDLSKIQNFIVLKKSPAPKQVNKFKSNSGNSKVKTFQKNATLVFE